MEIIEAVLLSWKKEWKCLAQAKKKIEKERKRKKSVRERETERSSRSKSTSKKYRENPLEIITNHTLHFR